MLVGEWQTRDFLVFVHFRSIHRVDSGRQALRAVDGDGIEAFTVSLEAKPAMFSAHGTLLEDREFVVERGRGKALPPPIPHQYRRELQGQLAAAEDTVRLHAPLQLLRRQ